MTDALQLRDNARYELEQIKDLETGINYLNKVKAIETWAKAEKKDAELQNMIAEQKLRTQRVLGRLIKEGQNIGEVRGQETGRPKEISIPDGHTYPKSLVDIGISAKQSSVFQQIAKIPDIKFEAFIQEKKQDVENAVAELTTAGALRLAKGAHVSNNSGENEWYTPEQYINSARSVMGQIDLDPASSECANEVIKAKKYFDEVTNGLDKTWFGSIWMNPPYAQPAIYDFILKLETEQYDQAIVLVNNATETKWGQKLLELCNAVCFHTSRIRFVNPDGELGDAPLQGQMIAYIGKNYKEFISEFKQYGICLRKGV
jgi:ParB family chromosome partitioning protein